MAYNLDAIRTYVNNPKTYTNSLYRRDPETYLGVPIYQAFMQSYGREPTQNEFMMYAPTVKTLGHAGAMAEIAKAYQAEQNTPDAINKRNQEKYSQEAPKHYESINQLIKSNLGREATQEEREHFGKEIASGSTDAYQLQQFLQQQPEYVTKQNEAFRSGLSATMSANDQRYFQEKILPAIEQSYAKQGRSFDSSSFKNAATQSAQQQNTQRENFLTNLTAQQYGNVQQNAYNDYARMVANQQALSNSQINSQYAGIQNNLNRLNEISDYQTQMNAYNQYLSKYGKRNNGIGQLIGGILGAGIGGFASKSPQGAMAGYSIGSGLGGAGQSVYEGGY